jgi:hypothetical protein
MKKIVLLILLSVFSFVLFAQTTYHLHDKVKVKWGGTWWDAEIIEVGNNQYKIHYDNYGSNWDEWVKTDRIQAKTTAGNSNHTAKENNSKAAATDGKFSVGDKVEAWSAGKWYPASVVSIGSGNYRGYYYIHFTDYSDASNQWLNASSVRKITAITNTANVSPRDGKYKILSYGSNPANPIYLGYFILRTGNYSYYNAGSQLLGSGTYSYDNASKTVNWNSGPFKTNEWGGTFEISREGKTHNIRLRSGTIGTNSIDAQ